MDEKLAARFWAKVDKTGGPDACWLWTAATAKGYGVIRVHRRNVPAHRLAYEAIRGPAGAELRHLCECLYAEGDKTCRRCCNPAHLEPGSRSDNAADMLRFGRSAKGERHSQVKLTEAAVLEIREFYATGCVTQQALADEFGVRISCVNTIVNRNSWRHI